MTQASNTSPTKSNKKILIFVFSPLLDGRRVQVNPNNSISVLFQLFPLHKCHAFYQQSLMNEKFSFHDHGISQGDQIVVLPLNFQNDAEWKSLSITNFRLKELSNFQDDFKMKRELFRLNDLKFIKSKENMAKFRSIVNNLSFCSNERQVKAMKTNLNFDQKDQPSTEPLPIIF